MTADEDVISFRIRAVEEQMKVFKAAQDELRRHVDERFDRFESRIGTLEFVRKDVYDVRHEELRSLLREEIVARKSGDEMVIAIAERSATLTTWNFGILMTLVLVLIGAAVKVLAG